jgi:protein-S-isoprenylcysteine O-methyltransferase Ste14
MPARDFEFRHRFWIIAAIFAVGFGMYRIDHVNAAQRVARWLEPAARGDPELERRVLRRVLLALSVLTILGAALRTWAAAYLNAAVVHDSRMHSDRLVADGPYRHVRNPLYLGLTLLGAGIAAMASVTGAVVIVAGLMAFQLRLIGREEAGLTAELGAPFRRYLDAVPRLLPSLTARVAAGDTRPTWGRAWLGEFFTWLLAVGTVVFALTLDLQLTGWLYLAATASYPLLRRVVAGPSTARR